MPDLKISAAADAGTLLATDMLPLARSGSTTAYHATMSEVAVYTNTTLPIASTSIAGVSKVDGSSITVSSGTISAAVPVASGSLPAMDGAGNAGAATTWSRGDHVHPSDTTRVAKAGDTMTGPLLMPSGSAGAPSLAFAGDTKTGLYRGGTGMVVMSAFGG